MTASRSRHPRRRSGDAKTKSQYVAQHAAWGGLSGGALAFTGLAVVAMRWAVTDHLTGVGNRHLFDRSITQALSAAGRKGRPLSVVIIDIDFFKRLNDSLGHQAGDAALATVGRALRSAKRGQVFRYGGEEFVVLLPGCDASAAADTSDFLRERLSAAWDRSALTASAGVAVYPLNGTTAGALVAAADAALYRSKEGGRNRTTLAS